ncbi:MAG: prolyl oligopeptidase family serine peptidase [candidate division WOR-3 bacterium]
MKPIFLFLAIFFLNSFAQKIHCDSDSDCFYLPKKAKGKSPALIYLSCTGATEKDMREMKKVGDSLGWVLATCHKAKKRRDFWLNDKDITKTYEKLIKNYPVDSSRVFLYGFSAMGVQALLTLFLHPEKFRGVISVCAHSQTLPFARWERLKDKLIYLISREKDWNLSENRYLHKVFQENGLRDTLVITPGEHNIGDTKELLKAAFWLNKNSR